MAKARKKPPPRLYLLTIALVLTLADQKVSAADIVANPRVRKRDGSKLSREVCFGASIEFSSVCPNRFRLTGACVCNITAARGGRSGVVYIDLGRFPRHGSSPDSLEIFLRISQILPRSFPDPRQILSRSSLDPLQIFPTSSQISDPLQIPPRSS